MYGSTLRWWLIFLRYTVKFQGVFFNSSHTTNLFCVKSYLFYSTVTVMCTAFIICSGTIDM